MSSTVFTLGSSPVCTKCETFLNELRSDYEHFGKRKLVEEQPYYAERHPELSVVNPDIPLPNDRAADGTYKHHDSYSDLMDSGQVDCGDTECHLCDLITSFAQGPYAIDTSLPVHLKAIWGSGRKHEILLTNYDDRTVISIGFEKNERPLNASLSSEPEMSMEHFYNPCPIYGCFGPEGAPTNDIFGLLRWLSDECLARHRCCKQPEARVDAFPSRLIYVGTLNTPELHLITTGSQKVGHYATLSYCWGGQVGGFTNLTTTRATLEAHLEALEVEMIPNVLKDAVRVCRELDLRYLWCDRLCIVQDNIEDWETESVKMGSIYSGGSLNLSATGSVDSATGLFLHRSEGQIAPFKWLVDETMCLTLHPLLTNDVWDCYGERSRVHAHAARGWTMQESLLAPRTIHFMPGQIIWDCVEDFRAECQFVNPNKLRPPRHSGPEILRGFRLQLALIGLPVSIEMDSTQQQLPTGTAVLYELPPQPADDQPEALHVNIPPPLFGNGEDMAYRLWYRVLELYTQRDLTYPDDRLPAIYSLATKFGQILNNDEYCAGLWRSNILDGVLFYRNIYGGTGSTISHAPSWSWASVDRKCSWATFSYHDEAPPDAEVVSLETEALNENSMGRCISARLTLKCLIATVVGEPTTEFLNADTAEYVINSHRLLETRLKALHFDTVDLAKKYVYKEAMVLHIKRRRGLLVEATGGAPNELRRIGIFISRAGSDGFEGMDWNETTATLI